MALKLNQLYNMDCMDGMKEFPDGYFELAIVDPIYGIARGGYMTNTKGMRNLAKVNDYNTSVWKQKKTSGEYFDELFRVSVNQIIWGGNFFIEYLRNTPCMIVWDKDNSGKFADCELAWTSFKTAVRKYKFRWNGMLQEDMKNKEVRIHPTQKPVALYMWLLEKYAKRGDKILDTHVGSASSLIACERLGFDYIGFEIDEGYYNAAMTRIEKERRQLSLLLEAV